MSKLIKILLFLIPLLSYADLYDGPDNLIFYDGPEPLQELWNGPDNLYQAGTGPIIGAFTATPNTIDLDTRETGTVDLCCTIPAGVSGNIHYYHGNFIPLSSPGSCTSGQIGATIQQPTITTRFICGARNATGATSKALTVTVTKDPAISNCRRISFSQQGFQYVFGFTVSGAPRPVVTYSFSGGQQGTIVGNLFNTGPNNYTWTINNFRIDMPNANQQTLTLTATNSSNPSGVTCSFNIN